MAILRFFFLTPRFYFDIHILIFMAKSLQCGFWPRSSQILIWILLWIFGWVFSSLFFQGKGHKKFHQNIPCKIHAESCSEKFPSDFCRSLFFDKFLNFPKNLLRLFAPQKLFFFSEVIFEDPPKIPFRTSIKIASRGFFFFFFIFLRLFYASRGYF